MDKITFLHLKKLLTCQPYFVWHDIKELNLNKNIENINKFKFQIPETIDKLSTAKIITQMQVKIFDNINKKFLEFIKKQEKISWIKSNLSLKKK